MYEVQVQPFERSRYKASRRYRGREGTRENPIGGSRQSGAAEQRRHEESLKRSPSMPCKQ